MNLIIPEYVNSIILFNERSGVKINKRNILGIELEEIENRQIINLAYLESGKIVYIKVDSKNIFMEK